MKSLALALPLAFASLSLAQLQGLPTCAQSCASIFLNGGIGNCGRDPACICADKGFIAAISCCLVDECAADDQQKAIDFAQQICKANDVVVPNVVSCSTTPSGSPTASAETTTSTTTSGAATTTTDDSTSTTPAPSTTSSGSAAVTSATSSTSSVSGNAAGARQTAAPVLGLAGLLAAAALL